MWSIFVICPETFELVLATMTAYKNFYDFKGSSLALLGFGKMRYQYHIASNDSPIAALQEIFIFQLHAVILIVE